MNENLNDNNKKTNNILPIIIIILLVVLIGLLVFILLTKKDDKTNSGSNTENNTETNVPTQTPGNSTDTNVDVSKIVGTYSLTQKETFDLDDGVHTYNMEYKISLYNNKTFKIYNPSATCYVNLSGTYTYKNNEIIMSNFKDSGESCSLSEIGSLFSIDSEKYEYNYDLAQLQLRLTYNNEKLTLKVQDEVKVFSK